MFDYKTTGMSLINALVTTPDSLETRIQLRDEFNRRGLTPHQLAKLRHHAPISLLTQMDIYEEEMREDLKEVEQLIDSSKAAIRYVHRKKGSLIMYLWQSRPSAV